MCCRSRAPDTASSVSARSLSVFGGVAAAGAPAEMAEILGTDLGRRRAIAQLSRVGQRLTRLSPSTALVVGGRSAAGGPAKEIELYVSAE